MELKHILEALLFSAQKPLTPAELRDLFPLAAQHEDPEARAFRGVKVADVESALQVLAGEHEAAARSFRLVCVAGAWQFVSQPEYAPWIKALVGERARPSRLSQPSLETLAIVAYRQPLTRAEIEQIRGVSVDGVMQTLLERGLVEAVGRAEAAGRPVTYGTTSLFLEYFGLGSLDDLPASEELRRVPVQRPEQLVTAEPGLATPLPEQLLLPTEGAPTASAAPAETVPASAPESKDSTVQSAESGDKSV